MNEYKRLIVSQINSLRRCEGSLFDAMSTLTSSEREIVISYFQNQEHSLKQLSSDQINELSISVINKLRNWGGMNELPTVKRFIADQETTGTLQTL